MKFTASGHDQSEPTSVYVLECGGRVKIGIAANVAARVMHLQLACPLPITVATERRFPTRTAARLVERSLHARFGEDRLHGEWFSLEVAIATQAVAEAPEVAEPVKIALPRPAPAPVVVRAAAKPRTAPTPDRDGPSWDDYEAMDDATWCDFMRPAAAVLDFSNPAYLEVADRLEADLRVKYPRYFARVGS